VYGVASFYSQFRFTPPGRHRFTVCLGTACHVRGGQALLDTLKLRLGIREGETTPDREFELDRVACLGCCALAPVVKVDDRVHAQVGVLKLRELVEEHHDKA
jgi:NADH-quinone oxidoreductase subunit E